MLFHTKACVHPRHVSPAYHTCTAMRSSPARAPTMQACCWFGVFFFVRFCFLSTKGDDEGDDDEEGGGEKKKRTLDENGEEIEDDDEFLREATKRREDQQVV